MARRASGAASAAELNASIARKEELREQRAERAAKIAAKFPKGIAGCCDLLYKLQEERAAFRKQVEELASREHVLEQHIQKLLVAAETTQGAGKLARVENKPETVYNIEDFGKFWKAVKAGDAHDLLQRRLSTSAVRQRLESGTKVPGVKSLVIHKLHVYKVKG